MKSFAFAVLLSGLAACAGNNNPGQSTPEGCEEGQILDGRGACITTCEATADCGDPSLECNVATSLCIPVSQGCEEDGDCDGELVCNRFGECVEPTTFDCTADNECPQGQVCSDNNVCEDAPCDPDACDTGFMCPADGGSECVPGEGYCADDEDCDIGQRCSDANQCVSRAGDIVQTCNGDGDCGPLMTCQFGVCVGCVDDLQCPEGECVFGSCVVAELPPGADCLEVDCADGTRCNPVTGVCEPSCESSDDCGAGQSCIPGVGTCIDYVPCEGDADCPDDLTCPLSLGFCVGCPDMGTCPEGTSCSATVCFPDLEGAGDPCSDVTCGAEELCDPYDGSCYAEDGTCEEAADCRPGQTCNLVGLCAGCSTDGDCRPDQRCLFGTCAPI